MGNLSVDDKMRILEQYNSENSRMMAPVVIYLVLVMSIGLVGNILTCYVYATRLKKTTANCFILWLAVLDTVKCLSGLPFEIYDLLHEYFFDMPAVCKTLRFCTYLTMISSVVTLLAIALDRYYKMCRPLQLSPTSRTKWFVIGSLAVGIFASWPSLILYGRMRHVTPDPEVFGYGCSLDDSLGEHIITTVYHAALLSGTFISAVCLLLLHACVGFTLMKRSRVSIGETATRSRTKLAPVPVDPADLSVCTIAENDSKDNSCDVLCRRATRTAIQGPKYKVHKATLTCVTVTVGFLVCFGPTMILLICRSTVVGFEGSLSRGQYVLYHLFMRSFCLTNAINPIIYGYLNQEFRQQCISLYHSGSTKIYDIICVAPFVFMKKMFTYSDHSETGGADGNNL